MLNAPGITVSALAHTYIGFSLSLFMVVHMYLGSTGTTLGELVRFMWSGNIDQAETASPVRAPDLGSSHDGVPLAAPKERI